MEAEDSQNLFYLGCFMTHTSLLELHVISDHADRETVYLRLPAVIGRSHRCNLIIAHAEVSRVHCRIYQDYHKIRLRDLNSLNGTYVHGIRFCDEETTLNSGETISIGPVTFLVTCHLDNTEFSDMIKISGSSLNKKSFSSEIHEAVNLTTVPSTD